MEHVKSPPKKKWVKTWSYLKFTENGNELILTRRLIILRWRHIGQSIAKYLRPDTIFEK